MDKFTNSCRACLSTSETFTYFLYKDIPPEMYWFCTSLEVKQDALPKSLCNCCYGLLKKFSEFKRTCIQSENILYNLSNNLKSEEENRNGFDVKTDLEIETNKEEPDKTFKVKNEELTDSEHADGDFCYDTENYELLGPVIGREKGRLTNKKNIVKRTTKSGRVRKPFKFTCELCNKKFGFKERFEAHKLEHEGKTTSIFCKLCNKTFSTWGGLKRHNESEHTLLTADQLTCKSCFKVFKNTRTLRIHQATHGDRKLRMCELCGKGFKTDLTLKSHLETHSENRERRHTCPLCGKKFLNKKTCATHTARRHSDKRYICHYCNYPFTDKSNLAKHILIHEGKQQLHKCDFCLKAFSSQSSLVVHRRIHTGEKPFLCSYCPKSFYHKKMLVDHQRIHTGEKPHKCLVCEQSFTQRGTMKRHMKVHDKYK